MARQIWNWVALVAAVGVFGGGVVSAQKKPAPAPCLPAEVPPNLERLRSLSGTTGEGFGHRPRAALVTTDRDGTRLVVVSPNRNGHFYLYAFAPGTLAPLPASGAAFQTFYRPSLDPRRVFFPQYTSVTADFNGDGLADFAFSNSNPGMIYVLMAGLASDGSLQYSDRLIATPLGGDSLYFGSGIGAGDVDADGREELIGRDEASFYVYRWNDAGHGGFGAPQVVTPVRGAGDSFGGFGFAVSDVTGDGHADLVAGSPGTTVNGTRGAGSVLVLQSLGTSFTQKARLVPAAPVRDQGWGHRVLAAPVGSSDLVADVVLGIQTAHRAESRDVSGPSAIVLPSDFAPGVSVGNWAYWGMESADLNGDARPDVVITANHNKASGCVIGTAFMWLSTGPDSFAPPLLVQPGATGATLVPGHPGVGDGLLVAGDSAARNGDGQLHIYRVSRQP